MTTQTKPSHDVEASLALLKANGVFHRGVRELASRYSTAEINRVLAYAKAAKVRSPTGLAVSMLDRGEIPPESQLTTDSARKVPPLQTLADALRARWNMPGLSDERVLWLYAGLRARSPRDRELPVDPFAHARSFEFETRGIGWTIDQQLAAIDRLATPRAADAVRRQLREVENCSGSSKRRDLNRGISALAQSEGSG
jgi:hypothetical protein